MAYFRITQGNYSTFVVTCFFLCSGEGLELELSALQKKKKRKEKKRKEKKKTALERSGKVAFRKWTNILRRLYR